MHIKIAIKFFYIFIFCSLFLASAFRYGAGTDFFTYEGLFESYLYGGYSWINLEPGFVFLMRILRCFSEDAQIFFLFTSLFITLFFFLGFSKYSPYPVLSVFVFVSMYFYFHSFNIVRQYLAMSIIFFWGSKYLFSGCFVKYFITVLLASTFHYSALIAFPLYFISRVKLSRFLYVSGFAVMAFVFFSYDIWIDYVFLFFPKYSVYLEHKAGTANLALLTIFSFVIVAIFFKKQLYFYGSASQVSFNLVYFSIPLLLLSYVNTLFIRSSMYLSMYLLILVPYLMLAAGSPAKKLLFYIFILFILSVNLFHAMSANVSGVFPIRFNFSLFL